MEATASLLYGVAAAVLAGILIAVGVIDMREMRIPDTLNGILFLCGLVSSALLRHQTLLHSASSAIVAFVGLALISVAYRWFRGRTGLGFGDVKFIGAAAAWIGVEALPMMILISCLAALIWVLLAVALRHPISASTRVPFGPFLALGLWSCWLCL